MMFSMARDLARLLLLVLLLPVLGLAQRSHGYLFVAPGAISARILGVSGSTATLHMGAGGEGILGKGIGIGGEVGAVLPANDVQNAVGLLSINGYYHFVHEHEKFDPFVTGGYTLGFRGATVNLFNVGGGMNYWFISRLGAKVEFRDHIWTPSGATVHAWGVRLGLTFR